MGMYSPLNPISNALSFMLVDAEGKTTSITLPVKHDDVEGWDIVAVDGGFAIAWLEGGQNGGPSRELELAYVTVR
jgi:hypothetical protein